jgi:putative transcriptional regulator
MNIEKIAKAIEADAGVPRPDLRQSLEEAEARVDRVTIPEQMHASRLVYGFGP